MKKYKKYFLANSVEDALGALTDSEQPAKIVAGGTDLFLDIEQERHDVPATMVDVSAVPEMLALESRADHIYIGASVPHNQITNSSIIQQHAAALAEASGLIGGPQVRNVACLGGNVGHALPAADGTIALVALEAQAEIASAEGRRWAPILDLFAGPGQTALGDKELIVGFKLPIGPPNTNSAFRRVMRPQGVAIAILNCAVWLARDGETIGDVRISMGPSGPTPRRLTFAEDTLRGKTPTEVNIQQANQAVLEEANFRTSKHRATTEYRRALAGVLLQDCIQAAWEQTIQEVSI